MMPAFEDPPPNVGVPGPVLAWALRLAWGVGLYLRRILQARGVGDGANRELVRAVEQGLSGPRPPVEEQ